MQPPTEPNWPRPTFLWERTPWMADAACNGKPTEWWFPARGQDWRKAKTICETCPVQQDCLDYALSIPFIVGIWGGTTGKQRRELQQQTRIKQPEKPIRHGTPGGYTTHRRRNETACPACLDAHSKATTRRKR